MWDEEKKPFILLPEAAAILLALAVLTAGAFLLLPPLHQENYSPCGNFVVSQEAGPLNINTATVEQLMLLPGVGEVKAKAIRDYITENGPFSSLEEAAEVKGISPKTVAGWKGLAFTE